MLHFELTRRHAGFILWGDPWALAAVVALLDKVYTEGDADAGREGILRQLAMEVRMAKDGFRRKGERMLFGDSCPVYGVELLWPLAIAQIGLLRASLAFIPVSLHDQATMYALEAVLAAAVDAAAMPASSREVLEQAHRIGASYVALEDILDSRCRYFISLQPRLRLSRLPMVLASLTLSYALLAQGWERGGAAGVIPAEAFDPYLTEGKWPPFEW